jgi:hypothetical protein
MAKPQVRTPKKAKPPATIELEPDAWSRFERFIDGVAKSSVVPHASTKVRPRKQQLKKRSKDE